MASSMYFAYPAPSPTVLGGGVGSLLLDADLPQAFDAFFSPATGAGAADFDRAFFDPDYATKCADWSSMVKLDVVDPPAPGADAALIPLFTPMLTPFPGSLKDVFGGSGAESPSRGPSSSARKETTPAPEPLAAHETSKRVTAKRACKRKRVVYEELDEAESQADVDEPHELGDRELTPSTSGDSAADSAHHDEVNTDHARWLLAARPSDLSEPEQRERKRLKNRIAAHESRQRRKAAINCQALSLEQFRAENHALRRQLAALQARLARLENAGGAPPAPKKQRRLSKPVV